MVIPRYEEYRPTVLVFHKNCAEQIRVIRGLTSNEDAQIRVIRELTSNEEYRPPVLGLVADGKYLLIGSTS